MTSLDDLYHLFHIFLVGLFAQFQPLAPADAGTTYHYEVQAGNDLPQALLSITVEEARAERAAHEFVLLSDYAEGDPVQHWSRLSLVVSDTARYVQRIEVADTAVTETIPLPPGHERATLGFGISATLLDAASGTLSLPTASGDTLMLRTDTYTYGAENGATLSVDMNPELGVVAASLALPGLDPVQIRLRPAR